MPLFARKRTLSRRLSMSALCKSGGNRAPSIEELPGSLPLHFSALLWRCGLLQRTSLL
jgi:hypothetical protein